MTAGALASGLLVAGGALGQSVVLTGLSGQAATFTAAQLAATPHASATLKLGGGRSEDCAGVPLTLLLQRVGAPAGKALKGPELADLVVVGASDGYRVVLALAETDPMVSDRKILLADRCGGAPLPDNEGPFRLVVTGDLRPARSARMVTSIQVRRALP
ncbi:MAG TPA: molybdopterin-binding oxidoreductase [Caulobacteraceae bacterium]|nr:molybdopterin-binding oxidoreductase [Caulobacteraceae bacterium]